MARWSGGSSALSRAMAVLEVFAPEEPFLSLTDIARRTGLAASSAHAIVTELARHGLLERLEDRSYRLGNRLWELGARTPGALGLREIALPYLQAVQAAVRQHAQLCVRSELDVLVVERLSARGAVLNASIIGGRIPLDHSSSGLVLLAGAHEDVLHHLLDRGLRPATASGIATEAELRRAVAETGREGYAVASGFIHPVSRGIAVPIRGTHDVVIGAIGVVVANDHAPADPYVDLLRRAASGITGSLLRRYLPSGHPAALPGGRYARMVNSSEASMRYFEQSDEQGLAWHPPVVPAPPSSDGASPTSGPS